MKAMQWLTKVILSTILVTAISLLTTWAIVSVAVEQLLAQYNIKLNSNVLSLPNLLSLVTSKPQASDANSAPAPVSSQEAAKDKSATGNTDAGSPGTKKPAADSTPQDAVAATGRLSTSLEQGNSSAESQRLIVTPGDLAKKKDSMSAQDKQRVLSILAANLPQSDMDKISLLLEDGITADELKQIEVLLQKSLKPDEYKELVSIIQKY